MVKVIAATRGDEATFRREAYLRHSVTNLATANLTFQIAFGNSFPLPLVFNRALSAAPDEDVLVFTHDDVCIEDWCLAERLDDALARYDVVGVAGCIRRFPNQVAWHVTGSLREQDLSNLSGRVAHTSAERPSIVTYGPWPREVKLLDGVFLAARAKTLRAAKVQFDLRFSFHFYDLDFCRSCEAARLRMGTWPIALSHESGGSFGSPEWQAACKTYFAKWGE